MRRLVPIVLLVLAACSGSLPVAAPPSPSPKETASAVERQACVYVEQLDNAQTMGQVWEIMNKLEPLAEPIAELNLRDSSLETQLSLHILKAVANSGWSVPFSKSGDVSDLFFKNLHRNAMNEAIQAARIDCFQVH